MKIPRQAFPGIERAMADLGHPETIWFRGHAEDHQLLPSLFLFSSGLENERPLVERYRKNAGDQDASGQILQTLIAMHHAYEPTRLLAWTERLHVALFCALIRQSDRRAVFVLNPVALNALSNISGLVRVGDAAPLLEHPIAIDGRPMKSEMSGSDTIFTMHGRKKLPLEQQCPDCVRKVVLTEEEKELARNWILFDDEWPGA